MENQEISWGKILVGAAIAAGAIAAVVMFPETTQAVGGAVTGAASAAFNAIGEAGSWVAAKVTSVVAAATTNKVIAIGAAAGAGALIASKSAEGEQKIQLHEENRERNEALESFAMREDMRKMQKLMEVRKAVVMGQGGMARA